MTVPPLPNQLCVRLMENLDLLRFFFHADSAVNNSTGNSINGGKFESGGGGDSEFLVFSLLVGFLHRDGHVGQQARDALINVMAMSKKNEKVGNYIARHSNFCPVSDLYTSYCGVGSEFRLLDWIPIPTFMQGNIRFH